MKFQKLTIHNIASIENAVIDFEAQPLSDAEVFLITGKTGAGKSTILDAICLALYADTPRLENTRMEGESLDGEQSIKVYDPRQLMRRNTAEAFVSLSFTGSNGVHYEAKWAVKRAHKKISGNIQAKDWCLANLDAGHTLNKEVEIKAEIKRALGLDFNQFCRTTMLAQGEFTRFLNSKNDEKAAILEKITGVNVYSKIGAKVYEVTCQKKETWTEARKLVEGIVTLNDEQLAEKRKTLDALDTQYGQLKAKADKDIATRDWITKDTELNKTVSDAQNLLEQARETVESKDFKAREALISEWNATIDVRTSLHEMQKAESQKKEQQNALTLLGSNFADILGHLKKRVAYA